MMETKTKARQRVSLPARWRHLGRYTLALTLLFLCGCGALAAARAGLARLFSEPGSVTERLPGAERAVSFNPQDPEARYARALGLEAAGRSDDALLEFQQAVSLRPQDYFLWQELARAREENNDQDGAIRALQEATLLATDYAQPRWQLGNALLRGGRSDEAFAELRRAVNTDPSLYGAMIDLAWSVNEGEVRQVVEVAKPRDANEFVVLAGFLVNRNHADEAMELVRPTLSQLRTEDRATLAAALIAHGKLSEGFEVWATGRANARREQVFDGGFEGAIDAKEQGFGWKPTQVTGTVHVLLDTNAPQSGGRSLRLDYSGSFAPAVPVVSQLLIVAPNTRYRLIFTARTESLKSAALPLVAVKDTSDIPGILAQSSALSEKAAGWQTFAVEFDTGNSAAVTINIQRTPCTVNPCPIFGRAWFDSFALERK